MIVDSTNPRIMADNIRELARNGGGGGGSDLPDVTAADNGKVLGVVEGSWNKMDIPSNVIDYSTTEQITGLKWIDGKDIYQKTFTGLSIEVTSTVNWTVSDLNVNGDKLIDIKVYQQNAVAYNSVNVAIFNDETGNLQFKLHDTGTVTNITIWYTKKTETRTKKKTTTKGEN